MGLLFCGTIPKNRSLSRLKILIHGLCMESDLGLVSRSSALISEGMKRRDSRPKLVGGALLSGLCWGGVLAEDVWASDRRQNPATVT